MLHRRQLPVVSPCNEFVGREATDADDAYCTRCAKSVHDLSRLREHEVIELLARTGGDLCVSYRVRDDGTIELRPPRRPLVPAVLALALAGCAGHLGDAELASDDCEDAAGFHVPCPPESELGRTVVPDGDASPDEDAIDDDAMHEDEDPLFEPAPTPGESGRRDEVVRDASAEETARFGDDASPSDYGASHDAGATASCVVTDEMRQREQRRRRFMRGKLGPMTDESICRNLYWRAMRRDERRRVREARRQG